MSFTVGCSPATSGHSPPSLKRISALPSSPSSAVTVCCRPFYTYARHLCLLKTGVGFLSTSRNPNRKQWVVKAAAAAKEEEQDEEEEQEEEQDEEEEQEEEEIEDIEELGGESEGELQGDVEMEAEEDEQPTLSKKKLKLLLKTPRKQRLVLKFIWMEKNIGLALDQAIPGHGTIPLTPYYFWPRKDAWEELKAALESKPWISQKRTIILLNQATDIINLWQQSGSNI